MLKIYLIFEVLYLIGAFFWKASVVLTIDKYPLYKIYYISLSDK